MGRFQRIYVVSPGNLVTGGPEALHQLVDALRQQGHRAFISYYGDGPALIPDPYRQYTIVSRRPRDAAGNLIVVPEVLTHLIRSFRQSSCAVWWLSVDNFFGRSESDEEFETAKAAHDDQSARGNPTDKASWQQLRNVLNFSQSAYAADFLARRSIETVPLGDYIHPDFFAVVPDVDRNNVIAFNPKKGVRTIERLMLKFPSFEWQPLVGMTRQEIIAALRRAKTYVDFGYHPGRDRIPREAALLGACVIVGRRGSAAFQEDVPLPAMYRLDEEDPEFEGKFASLAVSIMNDFADHRRNFGPFIDLIRLQKRDFLRQVQDIFS